MLIYVLCALLACLRWMGALSARDASLAAYLPRDGGVRRVRRRKSVVAGFARGMSAGRWWGMVGAMGAWFGIGRRRLWMLRSGQCRVGGEEGGPGAGFDGGWLCVLPARDAIALEWLRCCKGGGRMEAANHASRWSISDVCLGAFADVLLHDVSVLVGVADCASEGGWMNRPEVSILVHVLMFVSWLRHLAQRNGQSKRAILQSLRCCLPLLSVR